MQLLVSPRLTNMFMAAAQALQVSAGNEKGGMGEAEGGNIDGALD